MLMKLERLNGEQYKNYFTKFEWNIQRHVDFIADFTHVQYALRLRHDTPSIRFALYLVLYRNFLNELSL